MTTRSFNWSHILQSDKSTKETTSMTTTGGGKQYDEPVQVYSAVNDLDAQVIKSYLESNDIPVLLRGEAAGRVFGMMVGAMAEVRVFVPAPLAAKARELLEEVSDEAEQEEGEAGSDEQPG